VRRVRKNLGGRGGEGVGGNLGNDISRVYTRVSDTRNECEGMREGEVVVGVPSFCFLVSMDS